MFSLVVPGSLQELSGLFWRGSREIRGSLELQNGGLRSLGELWRGVLTTEMVILKFGSSLSSLVARKIAREVLTLVQGEFSDSTGTLHFQSGGLRALGEAWEAFSDKKVRCQVWSCLGVVLS
jgi:hypothetical protein